MNDSIGKTIRERRTELGITQEQLAAQVGVTYQAVSKWENGASCPDIQIIEKLSEVLGISVERLLTGNSEIKSGGSVSNPEPRPFFGRLLGTVDRDVHADVGKIVGVVNGDIYGNVRRGITGEVNNVYGNIGGSVRGTIHGDVTGYIGGSLWGVVEGRVHGGVHGKIWGQIIGDGINVPSEEKEPIKEKK